MDRQVFLAARPWLHAVGEAGSCTAGSEDELHSATAYEFKLQRLFAGVCCLHLLPLPPGALVTPDTHFLFFEPTAGADPAQLRLELWVATHLLHRTPSLLGVFDGRPYQIDHSRCALLQAFGQGRTAGGGHTPPFIRMVFDDLGLQLWFPGSRADSSTTAGSSASGHTPASGASSALSPSSHRSDRRRRWQRARTRGGSRMLAAGCRRP